ncbi:unnamed protein product [Ectocarpus sp. CCAP 1310/34]|nr:unnamed protein product [Ectocarpus sp. CCAP 1310/34]
MDVHTVHHDSASSAATPASTNSTQGAPASVASAVFDPSTEYCTPDMVFFRKPPSPFSQWAPSTFTVDGVAYSCAEQFFAAEKARLFGDRCALQNITRVSDPALHKNFGREVRGFDQSLWEQECENVVLTGSYAKLSQNSELRSHLLGSDDKILAEASPSDRVWGIGLQADHPDAGCTSRWRGLNLLGTALQNVRSLLRHRAPPPERSSRLLPPTDHVPTSSLHSVAPVTSRPYRVNPPVAKQVDAILDQYLAAGLIQHSTSPYSSPLEVIPKKSGVVRITVNYSKLNKLCALSQLPIPRVDDTLDKLLDGRIYSLFDMKSSFHQITVHRDTIPLTAFVASSRLFEWLKMPQGSSAVPGPNGAKVSALTKMPMPRDVKQLRSLLGGLRYYRKFLPNMAKCIRPLTTLFKKQEKFIFTPWSKQAVRVLVAELANPPVLVYPDWDAVSDGSRPFHLYCDASRDGFGGTLEREQPDASIRPIVFISRAILDSERHWTPLDLEAGSIVWCIKRLRGYLWGTKFGIFTDHKSLEHFAKMGENNARVQRWLEFLTAYNHTLEYRKGSANGNADFLSRLSVAAAECDRSGRSRLTPAEDEEAVFFIRSRGLTPSGDRAAADILVNRYIPLWGCPLSLLSDNGSQFCSKLSQVVYARLAIRKVATSSYHPNGSGGVDRVNHTMAQMLTMVVNERQDDWDIHLPHVAFAYNNSVSAATGLAPNEVCLTNIATQIAVIVRCALGPLPGNWRVLKDMI